MRQPRTLTIEVPMDYVDLYTPEIIKIIEAEKSTVLTRSLYETGKGIVTFLFLARNDEAYIIRLGLTRDLGFEQKSENGRYYLLEEVWND